eukprot:TRINITY_DN13170_c0_g2_i1.p1 TRINITY_DN13170_c0_g2~~TRINITY_DN13170_c0_g2_i1.p1  ORF type:complete len:941 (+),score=261.48 TRINITY_DN13170_c0_g2_i1:90-2825(+)
MQPAPSPSSDPVSPARRRQHPSPDPPPAPSPVIVPPPAPAQATPEASPGSLAAQAAPQQRVQALQPQRSSPRRGVVVGLVLVFTVVAALMGSLSSTQSPKAAGAAAAAAAASADPRFAGLSGSGLPCPQEDFRIGRGAIPCRYPMSAATKPALIKAASCGDARSQLQLSDTLAAAAPPAARRRFAVCFWGLTRSVGNTIGSIHMNLYGALRREGVPFSVFVHTYGAFKEGEPQAPGAVTDWREDISKLTDFSAIEKWYEPQDKPWSAVQVDNQFVFDSQNSFGLLYQLLQWGDGVAGGPNVPIDRSKVPSGKAPSQSWRNLMRGLYSLKRLTALWQHHQTARNEPFKAVLYARPDLVWITPIPPAVIRSFRVHDGPTDRVYLPRWLSRVAGVGGHEVRQSAANDRIALGTPGAMLRLGNRFDAALQYSQSSGRPTHSERLVGWLLGRLSQPEQNPLGSPGGWRVHAVGSAQQGGCLDVGIGVETNPTKYWPVPRRYVAGAFGGRTRAGNVIYVKDHELINHTYWIHPGDKPACGGARALALLSSPPLRDLVCGKMERPEWCRCKMEVAASDFWKRPPDDASASFAPKGEWRDVVLGGQDNLLRWNGTTVASQLLLCPIMPHTNPPKRNMLCSPRAGRQPAPAAAVPPAPAQPAAQQPAPLRPAASPAGGGGVVAMGSSYGGWNFAPNLLSRGSVVYSIGLGRDMSWEAAMLRAMPFLKIWGFDSTPVHMQWWKKAPLRDHPSVTHVEVLLAGKDGNITLHLPRGHVTSFVPVQDGVKASKTTRVSLMAKTLPTLARENGHSQIDLLKIDVEGAEFAVLDAWSKNKQAYPAVCQLLLELHARLVPGTSNDEIVRVATQELGFVVQHETKNRACPDGCVSLMHPAHCCRTAPERCESTTLSTGGEIGTSDEAP